MATASSMNSTVHLQMQNFQGRQKTTAKLCIHAHEMVVKATQPLWAPAQGKTIRHSGEAEPMLVCNDIAERSILTCFQHAYSSPEHSRASCNSFQEAMPKRPWPFASHESTIHLLLRAQKRYVQPQPPPLGKQCSHPPQNTVQEVYKRRVQNPSREQ